MNSSGFTKVPNSIIRDPGLDPREYRVLTDLLSYDFVDGDTKTRKGKVWPAQGTIARDTGLGRKTVYRVLKRLEAKGYVEVIQRGGGGNYTNTYGLTPKALGLEAQNSPRSENPAKGCHGDTAIRGMCHGDTAIRGMCHSEPGMCHGDTSGCVTVTQEEEEYKNKNEEGLAPKSETGIAPSPSGYGATPYGKESDSTVTVTIPSGKGERENYTGLDLIGAIRRSGAWIESLRYRPDGTPVLYVEDDYDRTTLTLTKEQGEQVGAILRENRWLLRPPSEDFEE